MLTVGLLAVVVYLYTVVAFNFFRKFYNKSADDDEPDMKCDDMMTVSVATVNSDTAVLTLRRLRSPSLCVRAVLPVPHVRRGEGRGRYWGRDRGPSW